MKTLLLFFAFFFLVSFAVVADVTIRDCGAELDRPGERYRLVRNLECTGVAAHITADNIKFNLGHRTISGPGGPTFNRIFVDGVNSIEIYNGSVTEYAAAILFLGGSAVVLHDLTITDCNIGISMADALNSVAVQNTISSITNIGISVTPNLATPQNNTVGNNTIVNSRVGIYSRSHTGAQIIGNVISDAEEIGIQVIQNSSGNIRANIVNRSGLTGIHLAESNDMEILNNTSNDGGGAGIALGNNLGEAPNDNNNIRGNTTNNNGDIGIFIVIGTGNTLRSNTALANTTADMWDNFVCENTWSSNTFVTDNEGDGPGAGCIQ